MYSSPETSSSVEFDVWIIFSCDSKASASLVDKRANAINNRGMTASNPIRLILCFIPISWIKAVIMSANNCY